MLLYLIRTRIVANPGQVLVFVYQYLLPSLAVTAATGPLAGRVTNPAAQTLFPFLLCYELGYVFNDFCDYFGSRKKPPSKKFAACTVAIDITLIVGLAIVGVIDVLAGVLLLSTALLFLVHTALPPSRRGITYLALNATRMTVVARSVTGSSISFILLVNAVLLAPLVWKYVAAKLNLRFVPSAWLATFSGAILIGVSLNPVVGFGYAGFILALYLIYFGYRVLKAYKQSFSLISHGHTSLSHDSLLEIADYITDGRKTFLTDHAEDVTADDFLAMRLQCESREQFVVGLEYPYLDQHVLAVGMKAYCRPEAVRLSDIGANSEILIWAHPNPSLRRAFSDSQYRMHLVTLFLTADAIEVFNVKAARRGVRWVFRMAITAACFCFLRGCRNLYWGLDSHMHTDLVLPVGWRSSLPPLRAAG
jgi:hypothetical protein